MLNFGGVSFLSQGPKWLSENISLIVDGYLNIFLYGFMALLMVPQFFLVVENTLKNIHSPKANIAPKNGGSQ